MNLTKSYEFFKPEAVKGTIHIVGCGSVGSTVAENLARCGVSRFTLWDFDKVEAHNIANQMFTDRQIGMPKVEALKELLEAINPEVEINLEPNGWQGEVLKGYIFLAVDSIEIRKRICKQHEGMPFVKAVFDIRTGLEDAQHYAANWMDPESVEKLIASMNFTEDEAKAANTNALSACGGVLGLATTVRLISAIAVNNFINYIKGRGLKEMCLINGFNFLLDAI